MSIVTNLNAISVKQNKKHLKKDLDANDVIKCNCTSSLSNLIENNRF